MARSAWAAVWGALLAGLFLHIWQVLDTSILYYGDLVTLPSGSFLVFPFFERGGEFFRSVALQPAGLAEYAGAYLSQLFITPAVGAAILTALAAVAFVAINAIASRAAGAKTRAAGVLGVGLLALIWNRYEFGLSECLAFVAALAAAAGVIRLRRRAGRLAGMVIGSLGLYCLLGGPGVLFAVVCGLCEALVARRYLSAAIVVLVGAAAPYLIGAVVLSLPVWKGYLSQTGVSRYGREPAYDVIRPVFWAWVGLYSLPVIGVVLAAVYRWIPEVSVNRLLCGVRHGAAALAVLGVVIGLGVAAVCLTLDQDARWVLRVHAHAARDQWEEALADADARPETVSPSAQITRHINRALFETGQLGSKLFAYPQQPGGLLGHPTMEDASAEASETFLRLGLVNQAEHGGCRLLEVWGPHPSVLKLLANVFIAKEEPDAARPFLNRLQRDVNWDDWARQALRELDEKQTLVSDPDIQEVCRCRPRTTAYAPADLRAALLVLLQEHADNHMAFEYLAATQLLNKQVGVIVTLLKDFGEAQGYDAVPEHYGEAVAVFILTTKTQPDLGRLMPSEMTMLRASRSFEIGSSRMDVANRLLREMPDSFFRFIWIGEVGGPPRD